MNLKDRDCQKEWLKEGYYMGIAKILKNVNNGK